MSLPVIFVDPTEVNEVNPSAKLGQCFRYVHPTYGQWIVRYVKFLDAVTYAAGQGVQFVAIDKTTVSNDIAGGAAVNGVAAGVVLKIMTQNYHGYVLASGYYPTVLTNGDDDIAAGDQIICPSAADGTVDSATTLTGKHLGFAVAADVDAANTVAAFIDALVD